MGRKSGSTARKRTKSLVSPDPVSEIQVNKRTNIVMSNQTSPNQISQVYGNAMNTLVNTTPQFSKYGNPNNNGNGNNGHYDNSNMNQVYPGSPHFIQSQSAQPYQLPRPSTPPSYHQMVLDKLEVMNKKLCKLDLIESEVKKVNERVAALDSRITFLESGLNEQRRKINDIETSRNFDADVCKQIEDKQIAIERGFQSERKAREILAKKCDELSTENHRLSEEVIDLQARSMRENLLFFGFSEENTLDERKNEDCKSKVLNFCADTLEIENAHSIKIDRIHRLGKFIAGKNRPIVAKFHDPPVKLTVKDKAFEKLHHTDYRVSDQFPKAIQERRRRLIPELQKKRQEGYDAVLSYDKLVIRGRRRNPINPPRNPATVVSSAMDSVNLNSMNTANSYSQASGITENSV
jgi:hypothetical protein